MKTQRSIVKLFLTIAILFLLSVSVAPAMAADATNGDMNSNLVSYANCIENRHPACWFFFIPPPDPVIPIVPVGKCTIDEHRIKHCPYPPFIIYPDSF